MRHRTVCWTGCVFLCGCVANVTVEPPPTHPASPEAAEAPAPVLSDTLALRREEGRERTGAGAARPGADHAHHPRSPAGVQDGARAYVCPMHPGVTSERPGECPECGMELTPRRDHDHPHEVRP